MNPSAVLVLSTLVATAAATGITLALRPATAEPTPGPNLAQELADLRTEHQKVLARLDALAKAPAPATAAPAIDRTAAPVVSAEQVAAAVEAYLQKRPGGAVLADAAGKAAGAPAFDLDAEFANLKAKSFWEDGDLWRRMHAAGKMEEAIKRFEELAKASPNDTKVQMELAGAYLSYVNLDQTKWQYSMKADSVFDKVLELDDKHWDARFTKAVSYTFWPDFLGKKKDAISHFETLVAQQDSMPPRATEAQTYLYLGNLLETRDPAKAK
jgi:tetratricopeptide (TPR) repeat protein